MLTEFQAQVPERLQNSLDEVFFRRADRAVKPDQHVDVRVEAERPASVASDRAHDEWRRGPIAGRIDDGLDHAVHLKRVARCGVTTGATAPRSLSVLVPGRRQAVGSTLLQFRALSVGPAGHRVLWCCLPVNVYPQAYVIPSTLELASYSEAGLWPCQPVEKPASSVGLSIGERKANERHRLEIVAAVQQLRVVAQPQEINATVDLERTALAGHHGHAQLRSQIEVSECAVAGRPLVVVVDTQTCLRGDIQRRLRRQLDSRFHSKLEIRPLVLAAVRLAVTELKGENDLGSERERALAVVDSERPGQLLHG